MTDPSQQPTQRDVEYKGAPLDSERGPGLGCFWIQLVVLAVLVVLTPLSAAWNWPFWISATLLIVVLLLLLLAGQTVIFLLRLVAADRRAAGRHRAGRPEQQRKRDLQQRSHAHGDQPGNRDRSEAGAPI